MKTALEFGCCLTGGSLMPQASEGSRPAATEPVQILVEGIQGVLDKRFSFAEWTVVGLMELSSEQFAKLNRIAREERLTIPAFNSFLPGNLRVTGPSVDWVAVECYVEQAMERIAALGGRIVVFGSGKARHLPNGFSAIEGMEQIKKFLRLCDRHAVPHRITVAIEPLNRSETNVIHTVKEGLAIAEELALPCVAVLADAYHMHKESEPFAIVRDAIAAKKLAHVHIAEADRSFPVSDGTGEKIDFSTLFRELIGSGYEGKISFECSSGQERSGEALAHIRSIWADAQLQSKE